MNETWIHPPRVLVIGCGGIGGVVAAHLAQQGLPVEVVVRRPEVAAALEGEGVRLLRDGATQAGVPVTVRRSLSGGAGPYDLVFLATQPPDVEAAAAAVAPVRAPGGRVVCFQNGLCESRVAEVLGDPGCVVGAIVAWGATMVSPGVCEQTAAGGFVIGRHDGTPAAEDPALAQLAGWLEPIGAAVCTDNLPGARWSKLALNAAVSSLGTINGGPLGAVVRQRAGRRLALEIMSEAVAVARRAGVRLEKVSGTLDLDWMALAPGEISARGGVGLVSKHALVLAVGLKYRRLYSSMLRAIEAGRPPAVDYLNGEIVRWGQRLEVPTPVNAAMAEAVWALSRGEVQAGRGLVERVFASTRPSALPTTAPATAR